MFCLFVSFLNIYMISCIVLWLIGFYIVFFYLIVLILDNILYVNFDEIFNNNCIEKYIYICCFSFIFCNF